jgi:alpha-beta hydrolase superfamily lysophospholipase
MPVMKARFSNPTFFMTLLFLAFVSVSANAESTPDRTRIPGKSTFSPSGRWAGFVDFGGRWEEMALRILPGGAFPGAVLPAGALLDLPDRSLYGYPLSSVVMQPGGISFAIFEDESGTSPPYAQSGDIPGLESTALSFEGKHLPSEGGSGARIEGRWKRGSSGGAFRLVERPNAAENEEPWALDTSRGILYGTLLRPASVEVSPIVLLLSSAGANDRDGNNFSVPGRNDALRALAQALRALGIASLRYDKRGVGESYRLVEREEDLVFADHIDDAAAVIRIIEKDPRYSRIVVAGHAEGALVGAAAMRQAGAGKVSSRTVSTPGGAANSGVIAGAIEFAGAGIANAASGRMALVVMCASGRGAVETVEAALDEAPERIKAEAAAIMKALRAGKSYATPNPYLADFFRPSWQPYLSSWLRHDLGVEIATLRAPILLVHGERDLQVSLPEFDLLGRLRPEVAAFVVPRMNHVLKDVPPDSDENYRAFTDPSFPLAIGLAELIAAFAGGTPVPPGPVNRRVPADSSAFRDSLSQTGEGVPERR